MIILALIYYHYNYHYLWWKTAGELSGALYNISTNGILIEI